MRKKFKDERFTKDILLDVVKSLILKYGTVYEESIFQSVKLANKPMIDHHGNEFVTILYRINQKYQSNRKMAADTIAVRWYFKSNHFGSFSASNFIKNYESIIFKYILDT